MTYLLLTTAILLSAIAEYYSIQGLMAIFSGAATSVAVMGIVLGLSKLVLSSWLYRRWKETPRLLRSYFVAAILVLMLLTSMGIFGFLSKAHSDQNLVSGDVVSQLSLIEEQIKIEKENIDAARKIIIQLDSQVNETISRTSPGNTSTGTNATSGSNGDAGISRSISIRRGQAKERSAAQETILSAQGKISKLNETKAPIAAKVRAVEAEVGPIKYIAALIYGDEAKDQSTLEAAVRWMILLIVAVFDPLAVLMFIAVNQDMARKKDIIEPEKIESPDTLITDEIKIEPEIKPKKTRRVRKPKTEWERDRILIPVDDGEST